MHCGPGLAEYMLLQREAVARGVFGVPMYCLEDAAAGAKAKAKAKAKAYWGREHLNLIRLRLFEQGYGRQGARTLVDSPHVWSSSS